MILDMAQLLLTCKLFKLTSMTNRLPPEERSQAMEAQKKLRARQTELCQGLANNDSPIEEHMLHPMQVIKSLAEHQHVDGMDIRDIVGGIKSYQAMTRRPRVSYQDVAPSIKHRELSKGHEVNTFRSPSPCLRARPLESPPFLPLELNPTTRSVEALAQDAASLSLRGPESWAGPFESPPNFPLEYNAMTRRVEASVQDVASFSMGGLEGGSDFSLPLEKDFTTHGPRGNLDCPFSLPLPQVFQEMADNAKEEGLKVPMDTCGDLDPIRIDLEERRNGNTSVPSAGPNGSLVMLCPIRFADRHTPEEVADYVKRHKHEVPADHTACMGRYQGDPEKVRMLDLKYGDDVTSLLHELTAQHLSFMPPCDNQTHPIFKSALGRVILKWFQGMDRALLELANSDPAVAGASTTPGTPVEDDRQSHFEGEVLQSVRVGESPERPWGVSKNLLMAPTDPDAVPASEVEKAAPGGLAGKCPFGHDALAPQLEKLAMADDSPADAGMDATDANEAQGSNDKHGAH